MDNLSLPGKSAVLPYLLGASNGALGESPSLSSSLPSQEPTTCELSPAVTASTSAASTGATDLIEGTTNGKPQVSLASIADGAKEATLLPLAAPTSTTSAAVKSLANKELQATVKSSPPAKPGALAYGATGSITNDISSADAPGTATAGSSAKLGLPLSGDLITAPAGTVGSSMCAPSSALSDGGGSHDLSSGVGHKMKHSDTEFSIDSCVVTPSLPLFGVSEGGILDFLGAGENGDGGEKTGSGGGGNAAGLFPQLPQGTFSASKFGVSVDAINLDDGKKTE